MTRSSPPPRPFRPTKQQIAAAARSLPDIIAPGLDVLFVGINPGLYTAAIGHHFGRPGNRFWPALHLGGLTPRELSPFEEDELLTYGLGITNIASRPSARADELTDEELIAGAVELRAKVREYHPRSLAFLGVTAFRTALGRPRAVLGRQPEDIEEAIVWVLSSPSGLNAHHTLQDHGRLFAELREGLGLPNRATAPES